MPSTFEIPLSPTPQTFEVAILGVTYSVALNYCNTDLGGWMLDLSASDGTAILTAIPLVTGHDLLEQYGYLGLGFGLWVATDADPDALPTFDSLGVSSRLYAVIP